MNFLSVIFLCAGCVMFGAGCMMDTDALSYDSEFFPLRHFEHRFTFPEYDRDIMPQFSEELTRC